MEKNDNIIEDFRGIELELPTNAEYERLAILVEEAAEVQQIAGKILRHGFGSYSPLDPNKIVNRRLLEKEVGDLIFAINMMVSSGDINQNNIEKSEKLKSEKIKQYLHFNQLTK